jgi:amidohydrolase
VNLLLSNAGFKPPGALQFRNAPYTVKPFMGGEDVSYFQEQVPGVFWFLGTRNPGREFTHPLHSPLFDFDEAVLPVGAALHAQCAVDFLSAPSAPRLPESRNPAADGRPSQDPP